MKKLIIPFGYTLWLKQEARLLDVMRMALEMMRGQESHLPEPEKSISRILVKYIRRANELLRKENKHIENLPTIETPNQPDHDLPNGNIAEGKIPDFLWQWYDAQEQIDISRYKYYAIECKRLAILGKKNVKFCKLYVVEGICRFIRPEHSYSKYLPSGTMIGYIQNNEFDTILSEVNKVGKEKGVSQISLSPKGWQDRGVSRLDQELNRPKVPPVSFHLHHLWVDIRRDRIIND